MDMNDDVYKQIQDNLDLDAQMNTTPIKVKILGGPHDGIIGKFCPDDLNNCQNPPLNADQILDQITFDTIEFKDHLYAVIERDLPSRTLTIKY